MVQFSAAWAAARYGLGPRPDDDLDASTPAAEWLARRFEIERRAPLTVFAPSAEARGAELAEIHAREGADVMGMRMSALFRDDMRARAAAATVSQTPITERLVRFWANHFAVSAKKARVRAFAGAFETEAIRPHVFGRFSDMFIAVARHPAMLLYLDNWRSVGPTSEIGQRTGRGLNENFAREAMELHSLGVEGGYNQADVIALARILTGWSLVNDPKPKMDGAPRGFGRFVFRAAAHEPGPKALLGHRLAAGGEEQGVEALGLLAAHPATARHVATKLARHFLDDAPEAGAVVRVAAAFERSGGDLPTVYAALFAERPSAPLSKVRAPEELVLAALRGAGVGAQDKATARAHGWIRQLGQPLYAAPSPEGWPDTAAELIGPEAVMRRVEWARAAAWELQRQVDARAFVRTALAHVASPQTRFLLENAPNAFDGLALAIAAPEFQRR